MHNQYLLYDQPVSVYLSAQLSLFTPFQWLESIEVTKSALQQKMLDIESEKVKDKVFLVSVGTFFYLLKSCDLICGLVNDTRSI